MNRRRALMVFSGAFGFNRQHNKDVKERPSDQVELPNLITKIEEHERTIRKQPADKVRFSKIRKLRSVESNFSFKNSKIFFSLLTNLML